MTRSTSGAQLQSDDEMSEGRVLAALTGMSIDQSIDKRSADGLSSNDAACEDLLELDIPHEGHIRCVIWIRLVLASDTAIEAYEDVSNSSVLARSVDSADRLSGHSILVHTW